ncbi:hypothetical protein BTI61_02245 [Lactobacillus delbrueckii subsp. bulgaricus]|nr:hypothetical protein [Lactobacillus delbrueckii subsp. bulgaricus]
MGQMVQDLLKNKLDAVAYHPRGKKIETASCYKLKTVSQFKSSKDCYSFNKQKSELIEAGKRNLTKLKPYWREFVCLYEAALCIMHSNTSRYGDNANVSSANAASLEKMFKLNVNREGFSYNNRKSS